jgi:hypothetical protein
MALQSSSRSFSNLARTATQPDTAPGSGGGPASNGAIQIDPFDNASEAAWSNLIRDVLALANSGGGRVLVRSSIDESTLLKNLHRFTDSAFTDVSVLASPETDGSATAIDVGAAIVPLGFVESDGAAAAAEAIGGLAPVFYFRHGGRSEPGTTGDMRAFVERLLRRVRRRWRRGLRRLLMQPFTLDEGGTRKAPARKRIKIERAVLQPVRIVIDPNAPALQPQDVDRLYPWRQKDLLQELNDRLGRRFLTTYDVQAVRRHHALDERPDFVFHLPGAGRRYSPAVADWIMEQYAHDREFFHKARAADQAMLRLRRKKPR